MFDSIIPTHPTHLHPCLTNLLNGYHATVGNNLAGIYLHGSIAMGCFNPVSSDIDLLVVCDQPLPLAQKQQLGDLHINLHDTYAERIEISVLTRQALRTFVHPGPFEFHYSDDHYAAYSNSTANLSEEKRDPDLAAHLMITKRHGVVIYGEPIDAIIPVITTADYFASIVDDAQWCISNMQRGKLNGLGAVPTYAVLNLSRVIAFIDEQLVTSKKTGGEWGLQNLPIEFRGIIQAALREYAVANSAEKISCATLINFANYAKQRIQEATKQYDNQN